jgi:DNA-binding CsgD family transcriptional regulator
VLAAATAIYEGLGFPRSRFGPAYKDEIIKRLRTALGDDVFDVAWSAGQRLSLEEALTSTLNYAPPEQPEPSTRKPPKAELSKLGLTAREAEILEHLLEGRSNAEIGEALFISPRTAGTHVANIFGKLGVSSRAAAVAAVLRSQGEMAVD